MIIASDWIDFDLLGKKCFPGGGGACSQPSTPFFQRFSCKAISCLVLIEPSLLYQVLSGLHMLPPPPPPPTHQPPPFFSFEMWKPQWPHLLCAHLSVCIVPSRLRTRPAQWRKRPLPPRSECGTRDLRGINPSVGGSWRQTARRKTRVGTLPQFVSANSKSTHKGVT